MAKFWGQPGGGGLAPRKERGGRRGHGGTAGALFVALAMLWGLAGCDDPDATPKVKTYEVSGQVLLANGKPLTRGRVVFVPQEKPVLQAIGEIGPDGSFRLTTRDPDDGAVPGPYKVRIEPTELERSRKSGPRRFGFPFRYTDEDTSGLIIQVKAEPNHLDPIRLR